MEQGFALWRIAPRTEQNLFRVESSHNASERQPENMSPVEKASQVYNREWCKATFREDLEAHLLHGYVHSTPTGFVMARPVDSTADEDLILDPWHEFPREKQNAWLIWLAAGDMAPLLELFPYELPLIGWQKRNRLRWYEVGSEAQDLLVRLRKVGHSSRE